MNLPIEQFIPSGATLIGTVAGLVGMWFKFQNKVERLGETDSEQDRQIKAIWKFKDDLEKDIYSTRERYNERMAKMEGENRVVNEQFKQIMLILEEIKDRISELESSRNGRS